MSVKLHQSFVSSSSLNPWLSQKPTRTRYFNKRVVDLDHLLFGCYSKKRCRAKLSLAEDGYLSLNFRSVNLRKHCLTFRKSMRIEHLMPFASADDGVTVNGSPQPSTSSDIDDTRGKLDQSVQGEDYNTGLVQTLHDAARIFELAIKEQSSLSKLSWFSPAWLGVDKNLWVKALSYQASVYSLLQAGSEISSRGDGRDRDINVFVKRSLLRQSVPLESEIREKLLAKQPEAYEWFWSEQVPAVVTSFVNYFEKDPSYAAATSVWGKGISLDSGNASDKSLLMLALSCIAAITKLGATKVSCAQFFSTIPDATGRLMDMLVEFIPIRQAYHSIKDTGLSREFLFHFGPRAATCRMKNDCRNEEVSFWVGLVQKQLQRAIDRERIWSRLATSESIEVLDRDLAVFGFFIALGRSTQSFVYASGFEVADEPIGRLIRYLIGGSVLYYPQLSSISSYQLYVEVVCEELDWLPFFPGNNNTSKSSHGHRRKREGPPNAEAFPLVLDVCSHWIQSFIKYSTWLENPSDVKAARFLSRGHKKLLGCMEELRIQKNQVIGNIAEKSVTRNVSRKEPDSFDTALENVEEAMIRLEKLLQELHVSSSSSGKVHLRAACSDLERIRKLKKEAKFLEVSFRAKAASLQKVNDDNYPLRYSLSKQRQYSIGKGSKIANIKMYGRSRVVSSIGRLWSFIVRWPSRKSDPESSIADGSEDELFEPDTVNTGEADSKSNEILRFELLRNELIELEKRVQKSANQSENEEGENKMTADSGYAKEPEGAGLIKAQKENIIEKSLDKFKETTRINELRPTSVYILLHLNIVASGCVKRISMSVNTLSNVMNKKDILLGTQLLAIDVLDILQGTQLLAIDVAAALGLLRRVLIGDELTEKEKQALRRTLTDLVSVVPISFLMLLPVTAVGHAAMLAAIRRYVPAMIPSSYGPERLDLLRQLEKVKDMETTEVNPTENANE